MPSGLTPQVWFCPALTLANSPSGGVMKWKSKPPILQQATAPSSFTPQVYSYPALTLANSPSGDVAWPKSSEPQQSTAASPLTPHVCVHPALTLTNSPPGRFAANGAWLAVQVLAHNLARWTARIGLGEQVVTTKTLRHRFFSLAGRLTRSARRLTLHLSQRWP